MGPRDHLLGTPCGTGHGHDLGGHRVVRGIVGRQLVEATGQPLAHASGVREHDRRGVLLDEPENGLLHRGPDGCASRPPLLRFVEGGHVGQRNGQLEFGRFDGGRGDDAHVMTAVQILRHRIDRSDRRGQTDPLSRSLRQQVEAGQRQAQVGPTLRPGHGMDLVDDDGLDVGEKGARAGGEQEEEALRRRDEDVRRRSRHPLALTCGGVCGADGGADRGRHLAGGSQRLLDTCQRCSQVALDIAGQRAQRGDVQDPAPCL